jgi:hypothetical protein
MVPMVLQELRVNEALKASVVQRVLEVRQAAREMMDTVEEMVNVVPVELVVHQVRQEKKVQRVSVEHQVLQETMELMVL